MTLATVTSFPCLDLEQALSYTQSERLSTHIHIAAAGLGQINPTCQDSLHLVIIRMVLCGLTVKGDPDSTCENPLMIDGIITGRNGSVLAT